MTLLCRKRRVIGSQLGLVVYLSNLGSIECCLMLYCCVIISILEFCYLLGSQDPKLDLVIGRVA